MGGINIYIGKRIELQILFHKYIMVATKFLYTTLFSSMHPLITFHIIKSQVKCYFSEETENILN